MKTNNMESKLGHFLDNGNVFNMFEIQKDRNKIYQKDGCLPSEKQQFILGLLCTAVLSAIFQVCCSLELSLFFGFFGFLICIFVRKSKYLLLLITPSPVKFFVIFQTFGNTIAGRSCNLKVLRVGHPFWIYAHLSEL